MTSFFGYINNTMIKLTIYFTCVLTNKSQTLFISEFMYTYKTVVHTNIEMLVLFFSYLLYGNKT